MKVSDLSGALLDYWVAMAIDRDATIKGATCRLLENGRESWIFRPSTDWAQGGPLIEKHLIMVSPKQFTCPERYISIWGERWVAYELGIERPPDEDNHESFGSTFLMAGMRCVVHMKFGDEVPDIAEG